MQALKKLTQRQPRAYSTHEVKDEMAKILGVKPTQTLYLRAYQQLKKLWDQDALDRVEKDWVLPHVTSDDLEDAQVEDLIG